VRKSKLLVGAVLAAALAAGCRRAAPAPADAAAGVTLSAPAPSSTTLSVSLGDGATGYTNEMQAENLRGEASQLGIKKFGMPSAQGSETEEVRAPIGYQEGIERTRAYAREFETQRRALDKDKNKSVALPNSIPGILAGKKEGSPLEPEPAGPKDPETK
jgi:hypothetical protein